MTSKVGQILTIASALCMIAYLTNNKVNVICKPIRVYIVNNDSSFQHSNLTSYANILLLNSNLKSSFNDSEDIDKVQLELGERSSRFARASFEDTQTSNKVIDSNNSNSDNIQKPTWLELNNEKILPSWMKATRQYKIEGNVTETISRWFALENLIRPAFDTPVILKTNIGLLEGVRSFKFNKQIYSFLGVPYAEPPIDNLRFKAPVEVKSWKGILQATKWPPFCVQQPMISGSRLSPIHVISGVMNEDCLYMNIWTTSLKLKKNERKPVMVFIHGGSFQFGGISADETDGSALASLGDVVVVTIGYRLGVFGFLNAFNSEEGPNNVGLLDQQLALEWIQKHIKSFGGDSRQVTLFGESAGGHSVGMHMVSPKSQPLFKRAILQSGVPLSLLRSYDVYADSEGMKGIESVSSVMLAKRLGCYSQSNNSDRTESTYNELPTNSSSTSSDSESSDSTNESELEVNSEETNDEPVLTNTMIQCMRNFSSFDVLKATGPPGSSTFMPTVNDKRGFFSAGTIKEAYDLDSLKIGPQKEYLIGTNTDEGTFMLHFGMPSLFPAKTEPKIASLSELKESLDKTINQATNMTSEELQTRATNNPQGHLFRPLLRTSNSMMEQFVTKYKNDNSSSVAKTSAYFQFGRAMGTLVTDIIFVCPAKNLARILSSANRTVYYYVFNHRSSQSIYHEWMGSTHHDEVEFIFGRPLRLADVFTGADIEMSQRMIKAWSHFAHTGKMLDQYGVKWPSYTQDDDNYMILEPDKAKVETGLHDRFCNIYDNVIAVHLQGY